MRHPSKVMTNALSADFRIVIRLPGPTRNDGHFRNEPIFLSSDHIFKGMENSQNDPILKPVILMILYRINSCGRPEPAVEIYTPRLAVHNWEVFLHIACIRTTTG